MIGPGPGAAYTSPGTHPTPVCTSPPCCTPHKPTHFLTPHEEKTDEPRACACLRASHVLGSDDLLGQSWSLRWDAMKKFWARGPRGRQTREETSRQVVRAVHSALAQAAQTSSRCRSLLR
jgi:hypothetical protein